jgi:quercetin dioxygenase-like cupin family protein
MTTSTLTAPDAAHVIRLPVDGRGEMARAVEPNATLHVLDGVIVLDTGDDQVILTPGDSATIPAGTPHRYWNGGDEVARILQTRR